MCIISPNDDNSVNRRSLPVPLTMPTSNEETEAPGGCQEAHVTHSWCEAVAALGPGSLGRQAVLNWTWSRKCKPQKTTDYKGSFPLGSSGTLPGYPTAHSKAANQWLSHGEPSPRDPAGCSSHTPPRPRMPSRSPGSLSRRNVQASTGPVSLGWGPKSLDQHEKQLLPSEWEGRTARSA